jgi:hypothetical protein
MHDLPTNEVKQWAKITAIQVTVSLQAGAVVGGQIPISCVGTSIEAPVATATTVVRAGAAAWGEETNCENALSGLSQSPLKLQGGAIAGISVSGIGCGHSSNLLLLLTTLSS